MDTSGRLAGHGLISEGYPHDDAGKPISGAFLRATSGNGRALCSCGELSPELPSGYARKRWHKDHKDQVKEGS
jgi:hypothetical protein